MGTKMKEYGNENNFKGDFGPAVQCAFLLDLN